MALDPRRFLIANCSTDVNSRIQRSTGKKSFFDQAAFIGDIEGTGAVGEGLRSLVDTSNIIAAGLPVQIPGFPSADASDELGADHVLSRVAIDPRAARQNAPLSPGVVNRGIGAAGAVWDKVKDGQYEDITDLPQAAADLTNLKVFVDKIFTPAGGKGDTPQVVCQASPYAIDLVARAPKNKFMFIVQFNFSPAYEVFGERLKTFTFVVKQSDRPTIEFDYEDVNLYNFKTKAIKRSTYNPINMRFYDDAQNQVMQFYNSYLRAMVPVSNINKESEALLETAGLDFAGQITGGLNAGAALGVPTHRYSASVGPLLNNEKTVLREITLYHVFGNGHLLNIYRFLSPKIIQLQLDELNMAESGEGNEVGIQFAYDGLYIEANQPINGPEVKIEDLTGGSKADGGAKYPLHYVNPEGGKAGVEDLPFGPDLSESTNPQFIPNIPGVPNLPSIPNIPNLPSIPNVPSIPSVPSVPSISIPNLPGVT